MLDGEVDCCDGGCGGGGGDVGFRNATFVCVGKTDEMGRRERGLRDG